MIEYHALRFSAGFVMLVTEGVCYRLPAAGPAAGFARYAWVAGHSWLIALSFWVADNVWLPVRTWSMGCSLDMAVRTTLLGCRLSLATGSQVSHGLQD